jgi:hypothetical protein
MFGEQVEHGPTGRVGEREEDRLSGVFCHRYPE